MGNICCFCEKKEDKDIREEHYLLNNDVWDKYAIRQSRNSNMAKKIKIYNY